MRNPCICSCFTNIISYVADPQVIVVDELGSRAEAAAVKSIVQRGVAIVATAHGVSLDSLIKNPDLNVLLGGLQSVTVSDAAAQYVPSLYDPVAVCNGSIAGLPI